MAQKSYKGKKQYPAYKSENRVLKNKIKKLERHCKRFPNDEVSKANLERIKKNGYAYKKPPREGGSNKQPRYNVHVPVHIETPGEQLSRLLGIPLPKPKRRRKRKPKVVRKKAKNVEAETVS